MSDVAARLQQAIALHRAGKLEPAAAIYAEVLKRAPNEPSANNLYGLVLMARGDAAAAVSHIEKAVARAPNQPDFQRNLSVALNAAGRHGEALKASMAALRLQRAPEALSNHGMILRALGRLEEAATQYRAALDLRPGEAGFNLNYANVLLDLGDVHEAERYYRVALEIKPDHFGARSGLGLALSELGRHEAAIAAGEAAVAGRPGDAVLWRNLAKMRGTARQTEKAREALRRAVALAPKDFEAWGQLALVERLDARTDEFAALERQFAEPGLKDLPRAHLGAAVSQWTDDLGAFAQARDVMIEVNRLRRKAEGLSFEHGLREIERVRTLFAPFPEWRVGGTDRAAPIFVVGLPRSGKTTLEGMLGRHSQAQGVGELRVTSGLFRTFETSLGQAGLSAAAQPAAAQFGADYLDYVGKLVPEVQRSIDTLPSNFLMIGMIALALPRARIIHCVRDPLDHAIGLFIKQFKGMAYGFSYELGELAAFYRRYRALMAYWDAVLPGAVLEVDVARLGDDGAMARVLDFCGLGFEAACVDPYVSEPRVGESAGQRAAVVAGRREVYRPVLGPLLLG